MAKQIKVSRQFLVDFDLCMKHYECPEDEIEWLKTVARNNYEQVRKSVEIIAGNIREGY